MIKDVTYNYKTLPYRSDMAKYPGFHFIQIPIVFELTLCSWRTSEVFNAMNYKILNLKYIYIEDDELNK